MKRITAIIRSTKFEAVKEELAKIGVNFFTYYEVRGFGQQKGEEKVYRGVVYDMGFIARYKLEILLKDEKVSEVVGVLQKTAKTGAIGDGKIYVTKLEEIIRIRTGETGPEAV